MHSTLNNKEKVILLHWFTALIIIQRLLRSWGQKSSLKITTQHTSVMVNAVTKHSPAHTHQSTVSFLFCSRVF